MSEEEGKEDDDKEDDEFVTKEKNNKMDQDVDDTQLEGKAGHEEDEGDDRESEEEKKEEDNEDDGILTEEKEKNKEDDEVDYGGLQEVEDGQGDEADEGDEQDEDDTEEVEEGNEADDVGAEATATRCVPQVADGGDPVACLDDDCWSVSKILNNRPWTKPWKRTRDLTTYYPGIIMDLSQRRNTENCVNGSRVEAESISPSRIVHERQLPTHRYQATVRTDKNKLKISSRNIINLYQIGKLEHLKGEVM